MNLLLLTILRRFQTLSFLAFVIRQSQPQQLKRFEQVPKAVLQLLQNCPPESTSVRKDILLAVRHILTTELKKAFVQFMDSLLDEQILIGTTRAAQESLRCALLFCPLFFLTISYSLSFASPLVYTLVGDLIHNVRAELNLPQITKIIHMFSRNLHDSTLSYAIHTMCAKLLYGLIDPLVRFVRQAQQQQQHQLNTQQQQQGQQSIAQLPPHPVMLKCPFLFCCFPF
jgi:transformation/transcription domain-associated protein